MTYPIEPESVVRAVDSYVERELSDREKYTNREPLDESGIYSLHLLAAEIYATAWDEATRASEARRTARHIREKDCPTTNPAAAATRAELTTAEQED